MNKFTQEAKNSLSASRVMQGRTKITTDEIITQYPAGITVNEFDLVVHKDGTSYPIFAFAEDPTKYVNGGSVASQIAESWVALCDGDIDGASAELKACGGCKMVVSHGKTKSGKNITLWTPIE